MKCLYEYNTHTHISFLFEFYLLNVIELISQKPIFKVAIHIQILFCIFFPLQFVTTYMDGEKNKIR